MSTVSQRPPRIAALDQRSLEGRLFRWILALTLLPALVLVAAGGWVLATSLGIAGALGPWEAVAESGRRLVELAEPGADPALAAAAAEHRDALSTSLTQARRWAFLGDRFLAVLPALTLAVALVLAVLAFAASRRLARQLARPIRELVVVAEKLGRGEPLPPVARSTHEVRVLDDALREAAVQLRAARERAVATERLRVWGEMARRVAHEMKNPLTPLRLTAHRLRAGAGPDVAEAAEVIGQEVERLEELAAQFSALGRPSEGPPTEVDVAEMLESLLATDVPASVRVVMESDPRPAPVTGHHDALLRAFRNLIRNAIEAVDAAPEPRLELAIRAVAPEPGGGGPWVEVRIADNGAGLPPDAGDRIFEPDFSTKRSGTGLGLALVRQAVEAHGGRVTVRDRRPGAEFLVRLPVDARPVASVSEGN